MMIFVLSVECMLIQLSIQIPLHLSSGLSDTISQSINNFQTDESSQRPQNTTIQENNTFKNEYEYKVSEFKTASEQPPAIFDNQIIYNNIKNPLITSTSLRSGSNNNNNVHTISRPFKRWLVIPSVVDKFNNNSTKIDFGSLFSNIKLPQFSKTNVMTPNNSAISNPSPSVIGNNSNIVSNTTGIDNYIRNTTTNISRNDPTLLTKKTYYKYSLEEVKTPDGKTRGHVVVTNGDEQRESNYTENGFVTTTPPTTTTTTTTIIPTIMERPRTGILTYNAGGAIGNSSPLGMKLSNFFTGDGFQKFPSIINRIGQFRGSNVAPTHKYQTPDWFVYNVLAHFSSGPIGAPDVINSDDIVFV